ncbi:MAG: glycosyltransferase [Planctomycetota bacterium]
MGAPPKQPKSQPSPPDTVATNAPARPDVSVQTDAPGKPVALADTDAPADPSVTVCAAVCTLREADNIVAMLEALRLHLPTATLLVVDDSSDDGTAELAEGFAQVDGNTTVQIREQRGLGGAIRAAMQHAVDHSFDYLINLDADFSHDPQSTPQLLEQAQQSSADVVIGSRYVRDGRILGWPLHRRLMSRLVNRLAIHRLDLPIRDCSGSMRCYKVATLRKLDPQTLTSNGYSVLEEVLLRIRQIPGSRFAEIPITFVDRQAGKSKLTCLEAMRSMRKILSLRS